MLPVVERFVSLQGEGPRTGEVTAFLRLAGCNLACSWCDTPYRSEVAEQLSPEEAAGWVRSSGAVGACLTGGEPLLHAGALIAFQRALGRFPVTVETNGTLPIAGVMLSTWSFVLDWKMPSAEPRVPFYEENLAVVRPQDALKFVVADERDYAVMKEALAACVSSLPCTVYVSPVWGGTWPRRLAEKVVEDRLPVRFGLQMHKVIWGQRRGV